MVSASKYAISSVYLLDTKSRISGQFQYLRQEGQVVMRQSLPSPRRDAPLPEPRAATCTRRFEGAVLVVAVALLGPISPAQAQKQGALQVSATVISVEPSQVALKQALDPSVQPGEASLVQITRDVVLAEDSTQEVRKPREVVTIAFVRN